MVTKSNLGFPLEAYREIVPKKFIKNHWSLWINVWVFWAGDLAATPMGYLE